MDVTKFCGKCRDRLRAYPLSTGFLAFLSLAALGVTTFSVGLLPTVSAARSRGVLGLSEYSLQTGPILLEGIPNNASDLVYSPDTGTLLLIVNDPEAIVELTPEGTLIRTITLRGFQDTEGITHVAGSLFAIVEERRNTLALITITPETLRIERSAAILIELEKSRDDNKGPEGIAFDRVGQHFLVVKERDPRGIYTVDLSAWTDGIPTVTFQKMGFWDWQEMADFSAIHLDPPSGHSIVLSDESQRMEERAPDGTLLDQLSLRAGEAGLSEDIPQPEGVTITPNGTLYVCSEPNLLYIFSRRARD